MLTEQLQHKIDFKTKPLGSLGQLEKLALQIGKIQNTLSPELKNPAMLVFAADHGLTVEGISPYPKEVTFQMVMNFLNQGAAINVFCNLNGINIKVVDAGVDYDFPDAPGLIKAKVAYGTKNSMHEPAMTLSECEIAMQKAAELVQKEAHNGCNVIGFGEMGIGNTSAASLLMHKFTGISIDECTGAGTGLDAEGIKKKKQILTKVADKHQPSTPLETLAAVGGLEIAMMCGAILEAKKQKMVLLIDGFIATSAFLTAYKLDASVMDNAIFCHSSNENGHKAMLNYLNAKPLLSLGMRLGEGTGAALAYPLVKAAVEFLNKMASFDDAGVSGKE